MDRKSKLELQQELRELMRGQPRKAISTMRVHELEQEIDFLKHVAPKRQTHEEHVKVPPKPVGPLGPRKMTMSEEASDDEETVRVPQVPPKRPTKYQMLKDNKAAREGPEGEFLQTAVKKETRIVKKPAKSVKIDDSVNPELTRTKSKPVFYEPACPKCGSTKYHIH